MNKLFITHNTPRKRVQISFPEEGRTKQSFKDECDINLIMAKFTKTGAINHVNTFGQTYGFANSIDFTEAMQLITTAQQMFDGLPSAIRTQFENDPSQFLDFVQDDDNTAEMQKMGLIAPEQPPEVPSDEKKTDPPTATPPPEEKPDKQDKTE